MLYEVMKYIRNFFPRQYFEGTFKISGGTLGLPESFKGHYFLIEGSFLNDGVYKYDASDLEDETFTGCITSLAPPKDFIVLVDEIKSWCDKYAVVTNGPYQSESFGGYSYTKATNANGNAAGWQDVFQSRLNNWRKL